MLIDFIFATIFLALGAYGFSRALTSRYMTLPQRIVMTLMCAVCIVIGGAIGHWAVNPRSRDYAIENAYRHFEVDQARRRILGDL